MKRERSTVRADVVLAALAKRHRENETFLTEVKTGPTQVASRYELQKIDALAIKHSWANPCFTGYEVKVSRSDFTGDSKWANYLNYCHRFYFACPAGLIKPEELPDEVGLVWVNPETGGWSVRKAGPFRPIEIRWEMLYYILISRTEPDRYPFFSSRREMFEAYLEDREDGRMISLHVGQKWQRELEAIKQRVSEMERQVKASEIGLQVLGLLEEHKINVRGWRGFDPAPLLERLNSSAPPGLIRRLTEAQYAVEQAIRLVQTSEEQGKHHAI